MDQSSLSFVRFQCILYDSEDFFLDFLKFYKLKSGDLISGGKRFCRKSELFGPPSYFNFKSFKDPRSLPLIRFQYVLYDSKERLSEF